jgi:cell division protease FtsH
MESSQKQKIYWFIIAFALVLLVQSGLERANAPELVPYSKFLSMVESKEIATVEIRDDELRASSKENKRIITQRIPGIEDDELVALLLENEIEFSGHSSRTPWWQTFLIGWVLPIGLLFFIYSLISRRMGGKGGPLSFGKSDAKVFDRSNEDRVTFDDVAGVDEAEDELREVVDFLQNPDKYRSLGARIPRGVLLVGPPGTGKTLLARAVAGEAEVPFFAMSGSEFVEMFVGVGAARMRSLFEQAKERAPCIVFVDELDAIGKSRGGLGAMATNDEREQTLNQLLVEMDGFRNDTGVVVMSATNRPEMLDPALVRAGRFDRQVVVDIPDLRGREEILKIHARNIELKDEVDLKVVARRSPGMSGADLANVVNEAALAAARRAGKRVGKADFEEAIDRIQLGLKKHGQIMSPEERTRVAYHESGHALVALSLKHADPVHKVTIVPRSIGALGFTLQLPTEERYLITKEELVDKLCVMLGGRAAEELFCEDVSTGASNDLERATETARQMVCRFGMSELGTQTFGRENDLKFLKIGNNTERNYSEKTAERIDEAVHDIIEEQRKHAQRILEERREQLEKIAAKLLEQETLSADELRELAGLPPLEKEARAQV